MKCILKFVNNKKKDSIKKYLLKLYHFDVEKNETAKNAFEYSNSE